MNGILAKKVGMTRIFNEEGHQIPVTVLEVGPCKVVQTKTKESDGYNAVQIGFGDQKEHRMTKAQLGHYKKAEVEPKRTLREFRVDDVSELPPGTEINASIFEGVSHVDIIGTSKGRGFQGVVRRHGMSGGRASHGSSNHRKPGSIGQCTFPSRVFKNRRMPGQMGNVRVTTQNIKVVQVKTEDNVLMVNGSVPGPTGAIVEVRIAMKKKVAPSS